MAKIFTAAQYDALKQNQRRVHDLLADIDKTEKCGVDCQAFRQMLKDLSDTMAAIEREFMTPPPKGSSV